MTGPHDPRPWWASTPGATADPHEDPLTRHRQARAGSADPTEAPGDSGHDGSARDAPTWWAPAAEAVARLSQDLASTATANADAARGRASWEDPDDPPAQREAARDPGYTRAPDTAHDPRHAGAGGGDGAAQAAGARHGADTGAGAGGEEEAAAHLDVCGVCPICVGLRALGTHRPELVGHLAEAARHLAAAVRSVVEAATEPPGSQPRAGADDGLTRIDLDDLDDLGDREDRTGDGGPMRGPEGG